jgi:hypothetical protein
MMTREWPVSEALGRKFDSLFNTAGASDGILKDLLTYDGHCADPLLLLMLKYGLLVDRQYEVDDAAVLALCGPTYLIPLLFPMFTCLHRRQLLEMGR